LKTIILRKSYQKERLFFETIYFEDQQNVSFKLYKADRQKEFDLDKTVPFKADTLAGLVENPVVFNVITNPLSPVTLNIENQVIMQPTKVFASVSIPQGILQGGSSCTTFAINPVLPSENAVKPTCVPATFEGNMSSVVKIKYNELSSFVSNDDVLTYINPVTNAVVGCANFNQNNNLFYSTIGGSTTSTEVPLDIKYYSGTMKKSFTVKSGVMYKYNTRLGNITSPQNIDVSPLQITKDANGVITAVMRDTSWTGKYCVNAFAMNCTGYADGQTTFCFQRLKSGDCVDVIVRKEVEKLEKTVQALSITSETLINSGVRIEYKGGNVIDLKPGFSTEINLNSSDTHPNFKAQIGGCNNAQR
jgi:hypothetical protein